MLTKTELEGRFRRNLARVEALETLYVTLINNRGRPTTPQTDILRAAVVFLHATLEDLLRGMEELRIAQRPQESFAKMPFFADGPAEKATLEDLAQHRGKTVDDLLRDAVLRRLERSNYNNIADIKTALKGAALECEAVENQAATLNALMTRRHHIAHRADEAVVRGVGHHALRPLDRGSVVNWRTTVDAVATEILKLL